LDEINFTKYSDNSLPPNHFIVNDSFAHLYKPVISSRRQEHAFVLSNYLEYESLQEREEGEAASEEKQL